jgi:hypothetical protein
MPLPTTVSKTLLAAVAGPLVLAGCCMPGGGEPPAGSVTAAVTSAQPTVLAGGGTGYSGQATITLTNGTGSTLTDPIGYSIDEPSGYSVNPVSDNECATLLDGAGVGDGQSCSYVVAITALATIPGGTPNDVTVHLTWGTATVDPSAVVVHTSTTLGA